MPLVGNVPEMHRGGRLPASERVNRANRPHIIAAVISPTILSAFCAESAPFSATFPAVSVCLYIRALLRILSGSVSVSGPGGTRLHLLKTGAGTR